MYFMDTSLFLKAMYNNMYSIFERCLGQHIILLTLLASYVFNAWSRTALLIKFHSYSMQQIRNDFHIRIKHLNIFNTDLIK